jgi:DNA-directed RNA polymerase subunit RPC12/RpoP
MPRFIDTDKLDLYDDLFMKGVNHSGVWVRYRDVENLIKNAPTADVEEVRHGEWIVTKYENHSTARCSECGADFYYFNKGQYHIDQSAYCPNCGAKMDGDTK